MAERLKPRERKALVLAAAVRVAVRTGYMVLTRKDIAAEADITEARVSQLFGSMPKLRRAVMRYAVRYSVLEVVAQGLTVNDLQATRASDSIRQAAIELFGVAI